MHHSIERFADDLEELLTDTWCSGDVSYGEMFYVIKKMFKDHLTFTKDMAPDAPDIIYPPKIYLNNIIFYDPINMLFDVVDELYPNTKAIVQFDSFIENGYGFTCFPQDKGIPIINILPTLEYSKTLEVLAHELAHVVAGETHDHDEYWMSIFTKIHEAYQQKINGKNNEI